LVELDLGHARKLGNDDPLVKAVGKDAVVVVDATAGLGRDASSLARRGLSVIAIERAPAVIELWRKAIAFAPWTLSFLAGDARTWLRTLADCGLVVDVVLVDPMFAEALESRRSAPKGDVAALRALAGDDEDAPDLLAVARELCRRVVVKRPRKAPPLAESPSTSWTGASTRFDLYLR
jgi:16S rRNA (guanine1516-N2)-methyltransferase